MKKLILLGLTIVLFTACQPNTPPRYTTSSPEIDAVLSSINAYENQDWETWMTHYADTAKIYHNTWKTGLSASEALESHKGLLANFSSYQFLDDPVFYEMVLSDEGETWVHFWGLWQGTLAANNQEMEVPVHLAFRFVDGKTVEEYGFWDNAPIAAALSAIEAAKAAEQEATAE